MALAGALNIVTALIVFFLAVHTMSGAFLTGAFGPGLPKGIAAPPQYFFMAPVVWGGLPLAVFMSVGYAIFWILACFIIFLQPTRTMFAYAFDGLLPKIVTKVDPRTSTPVVALFLTTGGGALALFVALYVVGTHWFFAVSSFGALFQLAATGFVGLAAAAFAWRRKDWFRAAVSNRMVLGIPVVAIAGVAAIVAVIGLWIIFLHYSGLGITNKRLMIEVFAGVTLLSLGSFEVVSQIKERRGVPVSLVYDEIPPE
jgi:amino acid transporter